MSCCKQRLKELHSVYVKLLIEKQRSLFFKNIIEQQLKISISDGVDSLNEIEKALENVTNEMLNLNIQQPICQDKLDEDKHEDKHEDTIKKKKTFKALPNVINDPNENLDIPSDDEIETSLLKHITDCFGKVNLDTVSNYDMLEQIIEQLKTTKTAKDTLAILKTMLMHCNVFKVILTPIEYNTFLTNTVNRIKPIILSNQKFDGRKIIKSIGRLVCPFDQRLLCIGGFENTICDKTITVEEIEKFKTGFIHTLKYPKTFRVFDDELLIGNMLNYGLALVSVGEMFENCINNPYGFKNISYVQVSQSSDYAFYTLDKFDGIKRCWVIDCRLEKLSLKLKDAIQNCCINFFRILYKSVFGHNNFIENYKTKLGVLEFDCAQLLNNIFFVIDFIDMNSRFREIVKTHCTLKPTQADKFDNYKDDEIQARNFKQYKTQILDPIKLLFDDIDDKRAVSIYEAK